MEALLTFPVAALGMTAAILSGHLLGANRPEALRRFVRRTSLAAAFALGGGAGLLFLFREPVARLLSHDPQIVRQGVHFLAYACAAIPFKAYSILISGAFSGAGAGATGIACKINCLVMWALQIPLAWTLGHACGASGVYAAMLCANVGAALCFGRLRAGKKWLECGLRKRQNASS